MARRHLKNFSSPWPANRLRWGPDENIAGAGFRHFAEAILSKPHHLSGETKFIDYLRQAGFAMFSHKMRSFLSILGILIGVAAVIAMLALGQGAKESIEKQLASLGSNLLMIRPGSERSHGVALETGAVTRFTFQDVRAFAKLTDFVSRVCPSVTGRGQLVYANKNWNTSVEGAGVDYAQMRAAVPTIGRFFTAQEVRMREKVAVLGMTVVKELFGESNPLGQNIKVNLFTEAEIVIAKMSYRLSDLSSADYEEALQEVMNRIFEAHARKVANELGDLDDDE